MSDPRFEFGPQAVVEYRFRDGDDYWIDIVVDGAPWAQIGPYDTPGERQKYLDELLTTMRSMGARDISVLPQ